MSTNNKNSTRYYSNKQEKYIAKTLKGKKQSNSGATAFNKGDVTTDLFLIEAKTKTKESSSITIQRDWIEKNEEEAFAMGRLYNAVAFDFGDGVQHYIIDEKLFKYLHDKLLEEEMSNA